MDEKLKPCPFCGGEASVFWGSITLLGCVPKVAGSVFCKNCKASTEYSVSQEEAIAAWNRSPE